ncbi:MAG: hypothetical protein KatS3mg127_2188 [Silanimonas sp.]|nr:MAG: hypothetical protein KatS3mg127_2188 [Silanimonas sp.]
MRKGIGGRLHLVEVLGGLAAGFVQGLERSAGKLELAGRLQGHRGLVLHQRDQLPVLFHPLPAEPGDAFQHCADATLALVGRR